jgi:hypothetical protein
MARTSLRFLVLFLWGWVALAPTFAPVAAMTPHMSMSDDGSACCDDCPDTNRDLCALMCVNTPPFTVAAEAVGISYVTWHVDRRLRPQMSLTGFCPAPDPPPPKSFS